MCVQKCLVPVPRRGGNFQAIPATRNCKRACSFRFDVPITSERRHEFSVERCDSKLQPAYTSRHEGALPIHREAALLKTTRGRSSNKWRGSMCQESPQHRQLSCIFREFLNGVCLPFCPELFGLVWVDQFQHRSQLGVQCAVLLYEPAFLRVPLADEQWHFAVRAHLPSRWHGPRPHHRAPLRRLLLPRVPCTTRPWLSEG